MRQVYWIILLWAVQVEAQTNLVKNAGFEEYIDLPTDQSQIDRCIGWSNTDKNGYGTPDYFRTDAAGKNARLPRLAWNPTSHVPPHSGKAVAGIFLFPLHEYLTNQMITPMQTGKTYRVSFFATMGEDTPLGGLATRIGILFSIELPEQESDLNRPLDTRPQLQTSAMFYSKTWQQISFEFTADKPYSFLTVGSFSNEYTVANEDSPNSWAYVFLDDFEVVEVATPPSEVQQAEIQTVVVEDQVVQSAITQTSVPEVFEGRKVQIQDSEKISGRRIEIEVSDNKTVDGDIISLNFNGQWVLRNHKLGRRPHRLVLQAQPGLNYLIVYAHNLGATPPNTAYITFKSGRLRKKISLNSGMGHCGAMTFQVD